MIKPNSLQTGDTVGIVATGRKVYPQDVRAAERQFISWGINVVLAPHLFGDEHHYLAASDDHRKQDFQSMLDDKNIKAIICARGGYGTTRILDQLVFSDFMQNPKWIVGFSDITALHLKLFQLGVESIHATMPVLFELPASHGSVESLKRILLGEENVIRAEPNSNNIQGKSTGRVVGGNLSLIVDSLATLSEPDLAETILIAEEIDERLYKIDRMFTQLKRAGKLDKLSGLVVGHMTDIKDTTPGFGETLEEIILSKVKTFDYPVAFNFPIGHENPNLAWKHGSIMALTVGAKGCSLESILR
ncbi:MAG: LD-carboxypeptidase [Cyclobacteriaceae bacterium]|nr:LD-carboxypeptidase [Cyclobacteriaceae bacterium]MDH4294853.1 LD-carboxypeptidase [Cyclobacteriaceae bacterium]MDH5247354.1 LD-carboxypeptidase [Cyclobacteriaceae bacterium]